MIQREKLCDFIDELKLLIPDHWEEAGPALSLAPHYEQYLLLDKCGTLVSWTARTPKLIGYTIFVLARHPHAQDALCASNDVLYVHPDARDKSGAGLKLIFTANRELKAMGVKRISYQVPVHNDWSLILNKLKFKPAMTRWDKYV